MNTTTDTTASAAKNTATPTPTKANKPQHRMARPAPNEVDGVPPTAASATALRSPKPATGSKAAAVIALLEREQGATLAELIAATNWLPHTTRAALTGLRKKGHVIERSKRGEETCYHIALRAPGGGKAG